MKYTVLAFIILSLSACTYSRPNLSNQTLEIQDFKTVKLFYYDADKDKDGQGNIICSKQGLVSVERTIQSSDSLIKDTVNLLLRGSLLDEEKNQGITTEFSLPGLSLESAELKNGILTLRFNDPENKSGGGSCRVAILWAQIEATAKQFEGVASVRFEPEELFQP